MSNKLKFFVVMLLVSILFSSCQDGGNVEEQLTGNEQDLPKELKGLKVYRVSLKGEGFVKIAVLNNNINSTAYQVNKSQENVIILNKNTGKLMQVSEVLLENDSIVVFRK